MLRMVTNPVWTAHMILVPRSCGLQQPEDGAHRGPDGLCMRWTNEGRWGATWGRRGRDSRMSFLSSLYLVQPAATVQLCFGLLGSDNGVSCNPPLQGCPSFHVSSVSPPSFTRRSLHHFSFIITLSGCPWLHVLSPFPAWFMLTLPYMSYIWEIIWSNTRCSGSAWSHKTCKKSSWF